MEEQTLKAMHALVKEHLEPCEFEVAEGQVLVTSKDQIVHDLESILDKHREFPKRSSGTTRCDTLASLIAQANRYKREGESVAYCSLSGPEARIVVVFNDHPAVSKDAPKDLEGGWRDHRAIYAFPVSEAWARWMKATRDGLSVAEFAELLENGIGDIRDPASVEDAPKLEGVTYATPAELLTLAEGLSVRVGQLVAEHKRLDNGASRIMFSEEHETRGRNGEPVTVRNGFLLGLQPFIGGPAYPVPARLRYRVKDRQITWQIVLHDAVGVRREAIEDAAERFTDATQIPLVFGTPDA